MGQQRRDLGRNISRRRFIGTSGAGVLGAVLAGCTGGGQSSQETSGAGGALQWWDQFRPLTDLFENELFATYTKEHPDVTVERRQMPPPDLGQALQIGRRSNQLPDVHSVAGLGSSEAALVREDWFQPIGGLADFAGSPVGDLLYDGVHRFGGEIYGFPTFSGRWHEHAPWFNTALLEQAGVDPEEQPETWDDFRAVAGRITSGTDDGVFGMVVPMKEAPYLDTLVNKLAMTAGAPGPGGVDWATGEYVLDSQEYVDAIEFLVSLQTDGVIHPASASMGQRDGRARWAAGQAAIYPWGPWFIGGLLVDEPEAVERGVGVWHIPTPETARNFIYEGPQPGTFWVSAESQQAEVAAELLLQMTTREFQAKLAAAMDVFPAVIDVVADADVHPAYARAASYFQEDVRFGPAPEVGNPDVSRVISEMRDVHPDVGEIAQSVLTGSSSDIKGALSRYSDEMSAERDRALKVVQDDGGEVDLNAWVFSNWDPSTDYDQTAYGQR